MRVCAHMCVCEHGELYVERDSSPVYMKEEDVYTPEKKICWVGKAAGEFWVIEVEQSVVGEVICCSEILVLCISRLELDRSGVWAFTIMDQNRDGFIDKADLRDTFAALGRLNVKNEELEDMVKEAPGPINFTVFLTMFGEKLKGTDPEETILNAFKIFDPEGKGHIKADYIKEMLMTQADRFSQEEINQMFAAFPPDVSGNLDYKNLCYVITHGEEKD
ncbi:hypothetical protein llap_10380 [Limosa lapponica baueri]|uniref:EF-hand domain-containing protein n=1 Tax=Limosa lapponica baueri TaxID=1758121 RepID=A0A2I0TZQ0_LIMLA|nr:hypothetical protein llap_10380 [Limosa lapponica baueri]